MTLRKCFMHVINLFDENYNILNGSQDFSEIIVWNKAFQHQLSKFKLVPIMFVLELIYVIITLK